MSGPKVDEAELRRLEEERLRALRNMRMLAADQVEKVMSEMRDVLRSELGAAMQDEVFRESVKTLLNEKESVLAGLEKYRGQAAVAPDQASADVIVAKSRELVRRFYNRNESEMGRIRKMNAKSERLQAEIAHRDAEYQKMKGVKRNAVRYLSGDGTGSGGGAEGSNVPAGAGQEGSRENPYGPGGVGGQGEREKSDGQWEEGREMNQSFPDEVGNRARKEPGEAAVTEETVREQAKHFQEELRQNVARKDLNSRHKNSLLSINRELQSIVSGSLPNDRKQKRILHLYEDYEKMLARMEADVDGLRSAYEEYRRECFDRQGDIRPLSDFSSAAEIQAEKENVRKKAEKEMARAYIQEQIDEVMKKYGYDIVRSDLLAEAQNQNESVLYGVDDTSAIMVYVSEGQQVTMRVVGIGFDETVSPREDELLYQKQCAFCSMHPQITEELRLRGVILHSKMHLPPDKKYNKKIQTREREKTQTASRAKKELKRAGQKVMHRQ